MRAAVVRKDKFVVEDIAEPVATEGQVLARVRKCGICGSDLHMFKHGAQMMEDQRALGIEPDDLTNGLVLGHEFVAEIESFGPGTAQDLSVGQRVCSVPFLGTAAGIVPIGASTKTTGAYAEKIALTEAMLIPVPDAVSDEAAALAEPVAVGLHAVNKANMADGEAGIVIGCGPIGLAVIAILKMRGATQIVAADLSPKRRALAEAMGATKVVDPRDESPYEGVATAAVYECTGVNGVLADIVKHAPLKAKVVVAGIANGDDSFTPMLAVAKELTFIFVTYYEPQEFVEALQAIADGHINWQAWITGEVGLDGIQAAFSALGNPETHAKILIDPSSSATL